MFRLLTLLRLFGAVQDTKLRAQIAARNAAQLAALYLIAAVFGFLALLFLLLALYLALATVWPAHWAAFAVFMLLIVIAGLIVLFAQQRPRQRILPVVPRTLHAARPGPGLAGPGIADEADEILGAAREGFRKHAVSFSLGAVLLGVIIGLWGGGPRR